MKRSLTDELELVKNYMKGNLVRNFDGIFAKIGAI